MVFSFRLLGGHDASGETDSSLHSHHEADFLEESGGSTIQFGAEGHLGFQDDLELSEDPRISRGSGGFGAFAKHGKSVTTHDDASQTEDGEFRPRGGILFPDPGRSPFGVWRREQGGHSTSAADEVDAIAIRRGHQGISEQKDGGHGQGAGAVRRSGSGIRGRTREWVEEQSSGVEDVGEMSAGHHATDSDDTTKPSHTDVRPKQLSAFTHIGDASAHGATHATQVRDSLLIVLLGRADVLCTANLLYTRTYSAPFLFLTGERAQTGLEIPQERV